MDTETYPTNGATIATVPHPKAPSDQWSGSLLPATLRRLKGLELVGGFDLPKLIDDAIDAEIKRRVTPNANGVQPAAGRARGAGR